MKSKICLLLVFAFFSNNIFSQSFFDDSLRIKRMFDDVSVLASDSLQGRYGGTIYEIKAAEYIENELDKIDVGILPGFYDYRQEFVIDIRKDSTNEFVDVKSNNILGYIDNNAPYTIVIGAHYDHVGVSSRKSSDRINNGADDNASGTAVVLEMGRLLKSGKHAKYNYILAFWGSEEQGLLGSNHFCSSNVYPFEKIAFYINFDMVGRLGWKKNQLDVFGMGSSPVWDSIITETKYGDYNLKKLAGAMDASDHTCFYENQTPYIYFTSGLPPEYHTPLDEVKLINSEGMLLIASFAEDIISRLDGSKPEYREVSAKEMSKAYWYFIGQFFSK